MNKLIKLITIKKIIKPDADAYSKKIFSMLSNGKISYVEYFKLMFKHQIGNINACGNRIGVYAYPPYSSIYGRVVLFYLHK
ncbi:hypothetical protein [Apilactobacillus ozensis]|uniref:hypothetical protein n=1 Tax=Apilactobacillus ozensis TaxID=866801 RepID=UPI0006D109A3|nr:hypothetical protein [Apilactobacillus ozensis]